MSLEVNCLIGVIDYVSFLSDSVHFKLCLPQVAQLSIFYGENGTAEPPQRAYLRIQYLIDRERCIFWQDLILILRHAHYLCASTNAFNRGVRYTNGR